MRSADRRTRKAKQTREVELAELRIGCAAAATKVKADCKTARSTIRQRARDAEASQKEYKKGRREEYSLRRGRTLKAPKMTRAESDSLAEHNIPDELLTIWREDRKRYSYSAPPDMRAEQFLEWAEAHGDDIRARMQEKLEQDWSDLAYARSFEAHAEQREAAPF